MSNFEKALKAGYIDLGFGKIPVAVLKDGTRLITTSGFHRALGKSTPSGQTETDRRAQIPPFLRSKCLKPFISNELIAALIPRPFTVPTGGRAIGYNALVLPKVCEVYLNARDAGVLDTKQEQNAACADLIIRALAHTGIIALVDEATGFQEFRDKTALQAILDQYLSKEAAKWAKTFPDEFYLNIFRLKNWNPAKEMRHKPHALAHITNDIVYDRLTPGLLESLEEKNPKLEKGYRKHKHHQFLSQEQGHTHLKNHIFMVQKLMKTSKDWDEFMKVMDLLLPISSTEDIVITNAPECSKKNDLN